MDAAQMLVTIGCRLDGLDAGLRQMDRKLGAAAGKADRHANRIGGSFSRAFKNMAAYGGVASVGLAIAGVAKNSMNLEKTLSSLGAVSGASAKRMQMFKAAAVDASLKTKFSSADAAQAMVELAKGGVVVSQIGPALQGTLNMAAAGGIGVADAASAAANAMNLFGLSGKHTAHVADAFATAANSTTADIGDFAMALSQGGGVAKMAGLSFDETVVSLEALAKAGIKNSDAGTSLKTSLVNLLTPTKKQSALMKDYGLSFVDANGNAKTAGKTAEMLRDKLGGLTKAQRTNILATLAGTDGVRYLSALFDAGPKKIAAWRAELEKSGTAASVAAKMQDNTAAKLQKLEHSALAAGGVLVDAFLPGIQKGADGLTKFFSEASKNGDLDRFAQKAQHAASEGIAAIGTAAHTAAPAIGLLKSTISSIGVGPIVAAGAAFKGMSMVGPSPAAIGAFKAARAAGLGFGASMTAMVNPVMLAAAGVAVLAGGLVYLSGRQSDVTQTARDAASAIQALADATNQTKDAARGYTDAKDRLKDADLGVERAEKNYADIVKQSGKHSLDAREAHQRLAEAKKEQKRANQDLVASGLKLRGSQVDEETKNKAVTASIDDVAKATSEAGRRATVAAGARGAALSGSAKEIQAAKGQAQALKSAGDAFRSLAGTAQDSNPKLAAAARLLGDIVDVTHKVPSAKTTRYFLTGAAQANSSLGNIVALLASIKDKNVRVTVTESVLSINPNGAHGGRPPGYKPPKHIAAGGINSRGGVYGGRGGQDSVLAMVKPGENVVNAAQWRAMKAGVDPDAAMSGAVKLAKGGKREPRSLDKFLGNNLLERISKANSTLGSGDDRAVAKQAVSAIKNILGHRKWHGKTLMSEEKRTLYDALGQYRQQAVLPGRSADDFLRGVTKARLAKAKSTLDEGVDDRAAAALAVTDLEKALKGKLTGDERNSVYEALGGFRSDAQAPKVDTPSPADDEFVTQRAHDQGVLEGLGRALPGILGGSGDIGTGQGANALYSAGTIVVDQLHLVNSTQNQTAVARANNAGSDTLYRARTAGSRVGVG